MQDQKWQREVGRNLDFLHKRLDGPVPVRRAWARKVYQITGVAKNNCPRQSCSVRCEPAHVFAGRPPRAPLHVVLHEQLNRVAAKTPTVFKRFPHSAYCWHMGAQSHQ